MVFPTRTVTLALALAIAVPALAQQSAPGANATPIRLAKAAKSGSNGQGAYMSYCGGWFRCYSGIPLQCADNTRPYQNIATHTCFCVHDGCPQ